MQVESSGSGEPVLLLHSLATSSTLWDEQAAALVRHGYRVLRYDARGHGTTPPTTGPYTMDLLVSDAVDALDHVGVERAHVVGLSMGGMTGMGLALDHPGRVASLVVADARADAPPPYVALWDGVVAAVEASGVEAIVETTAQRWFAGHPTPRRPRTSAPRRPKASSAAPARSRAWPISHACRRSSPRRRSWSAIRTSPHPSP